MKDFFRGIALITAALILFPAVPFLIGTVNPPEKAVEASADVYVPAESGYDIIDEVYVYDVVSERKITLSTEEYITAALAAQLPPNEDSEVLKAQAVLMYTYILRRRLEERRSPTPELFGCDISTDSSEYPKLELGEDSRFDYSAFRDAAKDILGEYCSYGGEPISVAYCASAGTSTESAKTVLGIDIPYLQSVATNEPDAYYTTVTYTSDEVFARLTTTADGYILLGGAEGWITIKDASESGYVNTVLLDSRFILSGTELAKLLNLPSAKFTFRYSSASDRFTFTVSGSGSLVGMSLRGAEVLAASGYNYKEILLHFFTDIDIETSKAPEQ